MTLNGSVRCTCVHYEAGDRDGSAAPAPPQRAFQGRGRWGVPAARGVDRRGGVGAGSEREYVARLGEEGRTQWPADCHKTHHP